MDLNQLKDYLRLHDEDMSIIKKQVLEHALDGKRIPDGLLRDWDNHSKSMAPVTVEALGVLIPIAEAAIRLNALRDEINEDMSDKARPAWDAFWALVDNLK